MHFVSEASKHAKLNEVEPDIPIRRVFGKTFPSAGMETCPTEAFEVWKPALRRFPGRGSPGSWEVGTYRNLPHIIWGLQEILCPFSYRLFTAGGIQLTNSPLVGGFLAHDMSGSGILKHSRTVSNLLTGKFCGRPDLLVQRSIPRRWINSASSCSCTTSSFK